jgi:SAM-dependent methyltransferase
MLQTVRDLVTFVRANVRKVPEGLDVVARYGHRTLVGGRWDELGRLQFEFLKAQGLKPAHVLLDIACGSLRGGRLFIPYLEPGHYLGMDKSRDLIDAGCVKEIAADVLAARKPEFVVSERFEFERFSRKPDFCLAQSLFSHLDRADMELCFNNLTAFVRPGCRFYATFNETAFPVLHFRRSNSHRMFMYTKRRMIELGERHGWRARYIGNWKHPRHQMMMEYVRP